MSIGFVNQLYGQEELKRLQRKDARFVNTGLVVSLSGVVCSDALEDGRVVSGVGGQYNFVTMAQALDDGRSILLIRSTRADDGTLRTNVRTTYGNVTIPRHLRDIVVTEYGIADVRGRTDQDVAIALIQIADRPATLLPVELAYLARPGASRAESRLFERTRLAHQVRKPAAGC